jgi:hypothetical protein
MHARRRRCAPRLPQLPRTEPTHGRFNSQIRRLCPADRRGTARRRDRASPPSSTCRCASSSSPTIPTVSLARIASAVQAEPLLSAKVIRMANTLALNPYRGEISSLKDAVGRIGLSTCAASPLRSRPSSSRAITARARCAWSRAGCGCTRSTSPPGPTPSPTTSSAQRRQRDACRHDARHRPVLPARPRCALSGARGRHERFAEVVTTWDEPCATPCSKPSTCPRSSSTRAPPTPPRTPSGRRGDLATWSFSPPWRPRPPTPSTACSASAAAPKCSRRA